MPLFNESLESIAQAIVTVKRALKNGIIQKQEVKGLNEYLNAQKKVYKINKTHLTRANKDLDDELQAEVEEFFVDEGDALYKMVEELLEEHEKDDKVAVEDDWDKQAAACAAWMKMDDKERAAMAALASAWQKSR
jgi:TfoX/Sxy family transcriptional regulator of competence genes